MTQFFHVTVILFICFLVLLAMVIVFHKYWYRFWIKHPVPWTTIWPSPTGVISPVTPPPEPLPPGYTIDFQCMAFSEIVQLLNENYIHPNTPFRAAFTEGHIENLLTVFHCTGIRYQRQLIGCLFDCPVHISPLPSPAYWIDKLCIDFQHRQKHLSGVLISHVIHRQQTMTPSTPVVALFHKEKIMPFPEVYACKSYFTVFNGTLYTDPPQPITRVSVPDWIQFEKIYPLDPTPLSFPLLENQTIWDMQSRDSHNHLLLLKKEGMHVVFLQQLYLELKEFPTVAIYCICAYKGNLSLLMKGVFSYLHGLHPEEECVVVVPEECTPVYPHTKWELFDLQHYYLYNYRLNKKNRNKPMLFPFTCF